MNDHRHNLFHGTLALLAGAIGTGLSFMAQIEAVLRIAVLMMTLIATSISVWKLLRGPSQKERRGGRVSIPSVVAAAALLLALLIFAGCSEPRRQSASPAPPPSRESVELITTVRASDGQLYRLVRKARQSEPGSVSEVDQWQPLGAAGQGLPVYTRRLQSASDTSDPIMTKAGVLE